MKAKRILRGLTVSFPKETARRAAAVAVTEHDARGQPPDPNRCEIKLTGSITSCLDAQPDDLPHNVVCLG